MGAGLLRILTWTISLWMVCLPFWSASQGVPVGVGGVGVGVGTGDVIDIINALNDYPSPYANKAADYRAVYLIRGEDMPGYGEPQAIRSLWFEVSSANQRPLYNFTIRMKQTTVDELAVDNINDDDLLEVYGPISYVERNGFNEHRFFRPFCWDGSSNVIVDICVTNGAGEISNNAAIQAYVPESGKNSSYHDWQNTGQSLCSIADQTNNAQVYEEQPVIYTSGIHGDSLDLRVITSSEPEEIVDLGDELTVQVDFQNYSCQPITNPIISFQWDNDPIVSEVYTGTVEPGEIIDFTFQSTITTDTVGFHELAIWVDNKQDVFPSNDRLKKLVWVRDGEYVGLDYTGKDFWIGFMQNYDNAPTKVQKLFITSAYGTSVDVSMPKLGWQTSVTVTENGVAEVTIPNLIAGEETGTHKHDENSPTGIHVQSEEPISVYGVSTIQYTSDAYLAIPFRTIGASYVVAAPMGIYNATDFIGGSPLIDAPAEILIVGAEDSTKINVQSPEAIEGYEPGEIIEFTISKGEARVLKAKVDKAGEASIGTVDLSGTKIWGNKRFSVFGGAACAMVPGIMNVAERCDACDHLIEQIPPKSSLGTEFYLTDFMYKPGEDIVRMTATEFPTSVQIGGNTINLTPNQPFVDYKFDGELSITANQPIVVSQMCTGGNCVPFSPTDPFMTNIIPSNQWGKIYTLTTPKIQKFNLHYLNVIKKSAVGRVSLDGAIIGQGNFKKVENTEYYAAKLAISNGIHLLTGDSSFSVYSYGFGYAESYGYPASGSLMDPVRIDSLDLIVEPVNPLCKRGDDGSIDLTVFGGIPPYQFSWSNGATTEDISNIPAGTYTVTVTDEIGLSLSIDVKLDDPSGTDWETTKQDVACFAIPTGQIEVDTLGGNGPFTILWEDGDTEFEKDSLAIGSYPFEILDRHNCVIHDTVVILQPPPLQLVAQTDSVSCFGLADGAVSISPNGGTEPYSFQWEDGNTESSRNDFQAGSFSCVITDDHGCEIDSVFQVNQPNPMFWELSHQNETCTNMGDGEIVLESASGGAGEYSFFVNNELVNGTSVSELNGGDIAVRLSDAKGCFLDSTITLLTAYDLQVAVEEVVPSTCGLANGSVTLIQETGPSGNGSFSWVNYPAVNSSTLESIAGNRYYAYEVLDSPCLYKDSVFVPAEEPLVITELSATDAVCESPNGTASISLSGDEGPYQYWWHTNPDTYSSTTDNLAPGQYVVVGYSKNCVVDSVVVIGEGPSLNLSFFSTPSTCGEATGEANVIAQGGSGNYSYEWVDFPSNTTAQIQNVSAGFYTVYVNDGSCNQELIVEVQNTDGPELSITTTATQCGEQNGSIAMFGQGGDFSNYTYYFEGQESGNTIEGLAAGWYQVVLTDGQCEVFKNVEVTNGPNLNTAVVNQQNSSCGETNGFVEVKVTGEVGELEVEWNDGLTDVLLRDSLQGGIYEVYISDAYCSDTLITEIGNDDGPEFVTDFQQPTCGEHNGFISITDTSAAGNLSVSWSTGESGVFVIDNLGPGTYFATVSNPACDQVVRINLEDLGTPILVVDSVLPERCDANDGSVFFSLNQVYGTEQVLWNGVQVDTNWMGAMSGGTSGVLEVWENGCVDSLRITIPEIQAPELSASNSQPQSCYLENGEIVAQAEFGSLSYQYSINNGPLQPENTFSDLDRGMYSVQVFDGYCWAGTFVEVAAIDPIQITSLRLDSATCAKENGLATIEVSAPEPYTVFWNGTEGGHTFASSGYFEVVVQDDYCSDTLTGTIPSIPNLEVAATNIVPQKCDQLLGSAEIETHSGSAPFTYQWDGQVGTDQNSELESGVHTVMVTDQHCDTTLSVYIPLWEPFMVAQSVPDSCNSELGSIAVQPAMTTGNTQLWVNGLEHTGWDITGLTEGNYFLELEDEVGCTASKEIGVSNINFQLNQAFIVADPASPEPLEKVNFKGVLPERWSLLHWEFSTGSATQELEPSIHFNDAGWYAAKLLAEHQLGCIDSIEIALEVAPKIRFYFPSSFSPDGDGVNDFFFPKGHNIESLTGTVFNRWGEAIFEFKSMEDKWDGTYKGNEAQIGTYAVRFVYSDKLNEIHEVFGKVTLIR